MTKTTKIGISLPDDLLKDIEQERKDSGESRSQFFRRAVEELLIKQQEREKSAKYIKAYKDMPETSEEIESSRRSASIILAKDPW